MTIFQLLPLAGLVFGALCGAELGARLSAVGGVIGALAGGAVGLFAGMLALPVTLKLAKRKLRKKSVAELRAMLRDPEFLAPNVVLLELGFRGEDIERELPVVLEMLVSQSRDRRIRGWHALASAFPDRAKRITDYRVDDAPEERQRKIAKLKNAAPAS